MTDLSLSSTSSVHTLHGQCLEFLETFAINVSNLLRKKTKKKTID